MGDLVLTTFDWVPEPPRGLVRDLRVRWALEEAGLPYRVEGVPFQERGPEHFAHQPFGQVPWLTDGDLSIFESGAILLHLGELSSALMPSDARGRSDAIEWLFAALNSVELASVPWVMFKFMRHSEESAEFKWIADFLGLRLKRMEPVLADREWLAGDFSVADILMGDVLRVVDRFGGVVPFGPGRRGKLLAVLRLPAREGVAVARLDLRLQQRRALAAGAKQTQARENKQKESGHKRRGSGARHHRASFRPPRQAACTPRLTWAARRKTPGLPLSHTIP